jgi:hypothetical protein
VLALLGACGVVVPSCKAKDSPTRGSPAASVSAPLRERRAFFQDELMKRVGHLRESKRVFDLPPQARPPFALLLDYRVDTPGAVVVEVNGKEIVTARSFPSSGRLEDARRIETPLTLSRFETNEVFTWIPSPGSAFARVQIVGYWAENDR